MNIDQFVTFITTAFPGEYANLIAALREYPEEFEQKIGQLIALLKELSMWSTIMEGREQATTAQLTAAEQAIVPFLEALDEALSGGGTEAALDLFREQVSDRGIRAKYLAVAG